MRLLLHGLVLIAQLVDFQPEQIGEVFRFLLLTAATTTAALLLLPAHLHLHIAVECFRALQSLQGPLFFWQRVATNAASHSDEWRSQRPVPVTARQSVGWSELARLVPLFVAPRSVSQVRPRTMAALRAMIESGDLIPANLNLRLVTPCPDASGEIRPVRPAAAGPNNLDDVVHNGIHP